jgi:hypothetical protein
VVEGEHYRLAGCRVEDAGEPVFHPPVVGVRSLQEKGLVFLGNIGVEILFGF